MGEHYGRRRTDTLDYMQAMLGQLRTMALAERCDMLAYLVEMAYVEASDIIRGQRSHRLDEERHASAITGNKGNRAS
ncbi:hypothetical protein [Nitratireductor sp. ZSWI3]|uniref:hypothetical protein n=1 Tax=Nitratireductor sp. ZSWI3 TaxID=2966359 RepID=UPI0021505B4C|nr:hypothetical protein [Nitratireductor sp. ZSWI3]MCR4265434.1 hypothetical protein [Nitratireductor sp. ZSWI3]